MMPMFVCGVAGGLLAASFAWPYGWVAAMAAYAFGGAVCAIVPGLIEWRQEVLRERRIREAAPHKVPVPQRDPHQG
jgi:hypothetical protein